MREHPIDWTAPAQGALQRNPEKVGTAVIEFVYASLADNPRRVGKSLTLGMTGLYSARRGDYRVIYAVDDDQHAIHIAAIEHRSDVYRRK